MLNINVVLQIASRVIKRFRVTHIYKPPSKLCFCDSEDINVYIVELKKQKQNGYFYTLEHMTCFVPKWQ